MLLKVYLMDRLCEHTAPYPNESSTVGLRAYGPSFGGTKPKIHPKLIFALPYLVPYLISNY